MDKKILKDKLKAAFIMRCAGCTLGAPVENFPVAEMESIAKNNGDNYPPSDYWTEVPDPDSVRYGVSPRRAFTKSGMNGVPVDDDTTYTLLNLLLLEKYGLKYTVEDVGKLWLDLLPYACTAEDEALKELRKGTPAANAGDYNDYVEWIGGAIRGDAFGYARAGKPAEAARLCLGDAMLTHRKNGVYGEIFTASAIAAAFESKTPLEAVREGMKYIPGDSELKLQLDWALGYEGKLKDYRHARALLDGRFPDMNCVHTINNMCALVFALILGGDDPSSCIGNSVAIGLDNDCNAATAGSIAGACFGMEKTEKKWYEPFNNKVLSYINGYPEFEIDDVVERFVKLNG